MKSALERPAKLGQNSPALIGVCSVNQDYFTYFKEYVNNCEPSKKDRAYAWFTAIGLQDVEGLQVSEYLIRLAIRNIEGEISFKEVNELLDAYYEKSGS